MQRNANASPPAAAVNADCTAADGCDMLIVNSINRPRVSQP